MRWRVKYGDYSRPKRPKVRRLTKDEEQRLLKKFASEVQRSPVLETLGCQITAEQGRFYVDRTAGEEPERWGRITPLEGGRQYLLERERREDKWYEVAEGGPKKVIDAIAGDTCGTFHGLGSVDAALRKAAGDPQALEIEASTGTDDEEGCPVFSYRISGRRCTAQEALHLFFGVPLAVLVEPRDWYVRHRQPEILQYSPDHSRVLVMFSASTMSGGPIIGTCLYLRHDDQPADEAPEESSSSRWGAYTIRPNASESIETAEAWIAKRKWMPW